MKMGIIFSAILASSVLLSTARADTQASVGAVNLCTANQLPASELIVNGISADLAMNNNSFNNKVTFIKLGWDQASGNVSLNDIAAADGTPESLVIGHGTYPSFAKPGCFTYPFNLDPSLTITSKLSAFDFLCKIPVISFADGIQLALINACHGTISITGGALGAGDLEFKSDN